MKLEILNLYKNSGLDYRYNDCSFTKAINLLKNGGEIKVELKNELKISNWHSEIWKSNYDFSSKNHLNRFDVVYVVPSFKKEKLAYFPAKLPKGIEGKVYGVAFLNDYLEQDQMTNAFLLGFHKGGKLVPLTLLDIADNEDDSIELVDLYVEEKIK